MEREALEQLALNRCSATNYYELNDCIAETSDIILLAIIRNRLETHEFGEEIVTCSQCGARTDFEVLPDNTQVHKCPDCDYEFLAVECDDSES